MAAEILSEDENGELEDEKRAVALRNALAFVMSSRLANDMKNHPFGKLLMGNNVTSIDGDDLPQLEMGLQEGAVIRNEIEILRKGQVPPEVIYEGQSGRDLTKIDEDGRNLYSTLVNSGFSKMFMYEAAHMDHYYPKLWACLGQLENWVDVGTGNGVVSNSVAFTIFMTTMRARASFLGDHKKPCFVSCDLSGASLSAAEEIANNNHHKLGKLFDLKYFQDTFQNFLANSNEEDAPRLITMFNVLSNYKDQDLTDMLQSVHDSMKPGDVFIPTFFQMEDSHEDTYHQTYSSLGFGSFRQLTTALYYNQETRDWTVGGFARRYGISPSQIDFDADWDPHGGDFQKVSLYVDPEEILHVPQEGGVHEKVLARDLGPIIERGGEKKVTFTVFESFRRKKAYIRELCESLGFGIEGWMDSRDGITMAPVLYKK